MVMRLSIRGQIFPKGLGDDADHPTVIPMDLPMSPTTPLGPMTRARAKPIETKVNFLLSELPLHTCETWLIPQAETLCVIRCLEKGHGSVTPNGQDGKDTKYKEQEEGLPEVYTHWTTGLDRMSDDVYYATFFLYTCVGPPSAEFCRTVANFLQLDDLRFINPWEA